MDAPAMSCRVVGSNPSVTIARLINPFPLSTARDLNAMAHPVSARFILITRALNIYRASIEFQYQILPPPRSSPTFFHRILLTVVVLAISTALSRALQHRTKKKQTSVRTCGLPAFERPNFRQPSTVNRRGALESPI